MPIGLGTRGAPPPHLDRLLPTLTLSSHRPPSYLHVLCRGQHQGDGNGKWQLRGWILGLPANRILVSLQVSHSRHEGGAPDSWCKSLPPHHVCNPGRTLVTMHSVLVGHSCNHSIFGGYAFCQISLEPFGYSVSMHLQEPFSPDAEHIPFAFPYLALLLS